MRHVDDETRRQIAMDRLQQLMRDQMTSAADATSGQDDLWEPSDESDAESKAPTKRRSSVGGKSKHGAVMKVDQVSTKGQRRQRRTIEIVLMDEPPALPDKDTFLSVDVPAASKVPGSRPPIKLCSVCSYPSPYKCIRCGVNFCSIPCNTIHKETKCLKFAD